SSPPDPVVTPTSGSASIPSPATGAPVASATLDPSSATASSTSPPAASSTSAVEVPEVTVPETGVPGLDSDVDVCRAWSEFAGSYQVVAVAAAFGDDTADVARLEVIASPVVAGAYDDMVADWPDELAA